MAPVEDELKALGKQRPGIEAVPVLAEFRGNGELGFALLEEIGDLFAAAAPKTELQPVEQPADLLEMRDQQRQVDRMAERDSERADFAAFERRGELPRPG